jgi:cytochrome o ubiquinol oxidase operon protein cyoD
MSRATVSDHHEENISLSNYVVGYTLSVVLTLSAYLIVTRHLFSDPLAMASIAGLAVLQFVVQLYCFLHLGTEAKPRWKQIVFWFMLLVVFILVAGSIWIMANLDYNMTESQTNNYVKDSDSL